MQKTRCADEQMVTILREADTKPGQDVAKKPGVHAQAICGWRQYVGSLAPSDVNRVRQLEQENGRLKEMVADRDLEIDVLQEITRKNERRTRAARQHGWSPLTAIVLFFALDRRDIADRGEEPPVVVGTDRRRAAGGV